MLTNMDLYTFLTTYFKMRKLLKDKKINNLTRFQKEIQLSLQVEWMI